MLHRKSGDPIPLLLGNRGQLSGRSFELVHGAELILELALICSVPAAISLVKTAIWLIALDLCKKIRLCGDSRITLTGLIQIEWTLKAY
ncbi:hypothetical protein [Paenibacillus humicus]|uniref:hypothetical protein n=1 Tax=Paenibacillus humicus TaxID=412861 RepID=UPI003D276614